MTLLGIDNVLFDVADLDHARAHYGSLGFRESFVVEAAGIVGYGIGAERPGLLIRARADVPASEPKGPHLWVEVPDARQLARQLGYSSSLAEVRTGWVFEVPDIWGNLVGFTDYLHDPDRCRPAE